MNLENLVGSIEETDQEVVAIDISDIMGQAPGSIVWQFRDPELPELFSVPKISKRVKFQFPSWPEELVGLVALLSISYIPQPSEKQKPEVLMAHLAKRMKQDFLKIAARFKEAFPHLENLKEAADEEKKD